jgi:hypothetical protein
MNYLFFNASQYALIGEEIREYNIIVYREHLLLIRRYSEMLLGVQYCSFLPCLEDLVKLSCLFLG